MQRNILIFRILSMRSNDNMKVNKFQISSMLTAVGLLQLPVWFDFDQFQRSLWKVWILDSPGSSVSKETPP